MKNVKVDLMTEFDNALSSLSFQNVDVDFYRDCVSNSSKMLIKKVYKNNVEMYYHIPVDNILNLSITEIPK